MMGHNQIQFDRRKLRDDSFWEFLFSVHPADKKRVEDLMRIIAVFVRYGERLHYGELCHFYEKLHDEQITPVFLCQLFCSRVLPNEFVVDVFKNCAPLFKLEEPDIVIYHRSRKMEEKNIFVSSTPKLNFEIYKNVKLADKVFEIVPIQRRIELTELMEKLVLTKEYKEVRVATAPPLEPMKFIGFLQMYWSKVFDIIPDHETRKVWIKRKVMQHEKPSQVTMEMKKIIQAKQVPSFPLPSDLLTKGHIVQLHRTKTPSDGIGFQLLELQDDFNYVQMKLNEYHYEIGQLHDKDEIKMRKLHPNETYEGTVCLRPSTNERGEEVFKRCQILGQSNGRAMVQDADFPRIGFEDPKNLYQIPPYLIGIRQTCVYGVFEGHNFLSENEKQLWENAMDIMIERNVRNIAYFQKVAQRVEYSGRRKNAIFLCQVQVNRLGQTHALKFYPRDIGA